MTPQFVHSALQYHDYAVLICHLDYGPILRKGMSSDSGESDFISQYFTKAFWRVCASHKEEVERNCFDLEKLSPYLHNPACFVTLGDTGGLGIVITDDFDLVHRVTTDLDASVKQVCFAFSTKSESMVPAGAPVPPWACSLHDLISKDPSSDKSTWYPYHKRIEEEHPLVGVTYFKLSGLALLGPGLFLQQAILKAMCVRITKTLDRLRQACTDNTVDPRIMTAADIDSFRSVFLDPQGWTDVCTLSFCKNYSVIGAVLKDLRNLTFMELFRVEPGSDGDPSLSDIQSLFAAHRLLTRIPHLLPDIPKVDPEVVYSTDSNHIFLSSVTTLGVSHTALLCKTRAESGPLYGGYVSLENRITHFPGHSSEVYQGIAKMEKDDSDPPLREPTSVFTGNYDWVLMGIYDSCNKPPVPGVSSVSSAIPLFYAFRRLKRLIIELGYDRYDNQEGGAAGRPPRFGSDILNLCTELQIPVPYSGNPSIQMENHLPFPKILYYLTENVFKDGPNGPARLSLKCLVDSLRRLRIPAPLGRSIIYLYTDFRRCLRDSFLVENVLDLYETFATLHLILTEAVFPRGPLETQYAERSGLWYSHLKAADLEQLNAIVEFLQNALIHRVDLTFREMNRWDLAVDFRGGLNRLINAADAPLKCCMGILRRLRRSIDGPREDDDPFRHFGMASRITFNSTAQLRQYVLGEGTPYSTRQKAFLASINVNVYHLIRPLEFRTYFHEIAHPLMEALQNRPCRFLAVIGKHCLSSTRLGDICFRDAPTRPMTPDEIYTLQRCHELFAEMLVFDLIFNHDVAVYLRQFLSSYSLHPQHYGRDDKFTGENIGEILIRAFLTTYPFVLSNTGGSKGKPSHTQSSDRVNFFDPIIIAELNTLSEKDQAEKVECWQGLAVSDFLEMVSQHGRFIIEFEEFWGDMALQYDILTKLRLRIRDSIVAISCIWQEVSEICEGLRKGVRDMGPPINPINEGELLAAIDLSLREGRPISRVLQWQSNTPLSAKCQDAPDERRQCLDALWLTCHLLHKHTAQIIQAVDPQKPVFLRRRHIDGKPERNISTDGIESNHNSILFDRNMSTIFITSATLRRKYLQQQICLIKTFWDISTNLRSRRLFDLLSTAWPDCEGAKPHPKSGIDPGNICPKAASES